jgi:uncharacterized protein YndB with AHSA1/START domain
VTADAEVQVAASGEREIIITRVFDAPRDLVFEAWTTPELVKLWLGVFGGWSLVICEIQLSVGGHFRYVWHGPDGAVMSMRGMYRDVLVPERIVSVGAVDDCHPGDAVSTVTFVERDGETTVTNVVLYDSREVRDGMLRSPMRRGVAAGYERLAGLLKARQRACGGRR